MYVIAGALAGAALVYCIIRFWVFPTFFNLDALGRMQFGKLYEEPRARGRSPSEARIDAMTSLRAQWDRELVERTGVPLDVIQEFRKRYPEHTLEARVIHVGEGVEYEVTGYQGGGLEPGGSYDSGYDYHTEVFRPTDRANS